MKDQYNALNNRDQCLRQMNPAEFNAYLDSIEQKRIGRKPIGKCRKMFKIYFILCGILTNAIILIWLVVRLLVYIQAYLLIS